MNYLKALISKNYTGPNTIQRIRKPKFYIPTRKQYEIVEELVYEHIEGGIVSRNEEYEDDDDESIGFEKVDYYYDSDDGYESDGMDRCRICNKKYCIIHDDETPAFGGYYDDYEEHRPYSQCMDCRYTVFSKCKSCVEKEDIRYGRRYC